MAKNFVKKYGEWAIVTGGSSGIGKSFSEQLASKGMNLVIVGRSQEKLDATAQEITSEFSVEVKTLSLDFYQSDAASKLADATQALDIGLIVLNAGVEVTGQFAKRQLIEHERLVQLNVLTPTQLAHTFADRFVQKGRGGIIFVSSLFGYQGVPMFTSYCASKSYVLSMGEGLSVELKPYGVDVTVVSPGPTNTNMLNGMDINFGKMPVITMQPKSVAKAALSGLGRSISVVPGFLNKIYVWENRLMPRSWPIKMFGMLVRFALDKNKKHEYVLPKQQKSA